MKVVKTGVSLYHVDISMIIQGVREGEEIVLCVKDFHPVLEVLVGRMMERQMALFLNKCSLQEVRS